MIGMPPATAASKATITPFSCAAAKISLPCRAISALFAVTTCLPFAMARSTSARRLGAADQFDDHVDLGIVHHGRPDRRSGGCRRSQIRGGTGRAPPRRPR
jgi:hypothetical protein